MTVLRGTTRIVDATRTAIFFDGRRVAGPPLRVFEEDSGWRVPGADWWDGKSWHDNEAPACLEPGSRRQQVLMGVLEAEGAEDAPGHGVVVWLKCLEQRP